MREFRQDRIFLATVVGFLVANPILIVLALHGGGATSFAWSRVLGQLATGLVFVLSHPQALPARLAIRAGAAAARASGCRSSIGQPGELDAC